MGPEAILLSVIRDGREGTYRFTCPTCLDNVEKRADRKIVALLVSAGVDVMNGERSTPEAGLFDQTPDDPRRALPDLPPFSVDDLIEFHFQLQDDRFIRDFLAKQ